MAQSAAVEFNHTSIGPEHLLLGILRTEGPTRNALHSLGIDLEHAQRAVEAIAPRGTDDSTGRGGLPLAPRLSEVIDHAEALRSQAKKADLTPSLLLVTLCDDEAASKVFATLGTTPEQIREAVGTID
jgi:ATP-dependent Clp protease ATP-binding subunit ClpA